MQQRRRNLGADSSFWLKNKCHEAENAIDEESQHRVKII